MKVNNILVYGERLGDLLEATELAEAAGRGDPPVPYEDALISCLFRALARSSAERLLQVADSAHPLNLVFLQEHLIGIAYLAVIDEVDAVLGDPLVLKSHPALAAVPSRRKRLLGTGADV